MESNENGSSKGKRTTISVENKPYHSACGSDEMPETGSTHGKRLKKDDSEINVIPESDNSDDLSDSGINSNFENKIIESSSQSELNSPDSGNLESCSTGLEHKVSDKGNFRTFENETSINSDITDSDDEVSDVKLSSQSEVQIESLSSAECYNSRNHKSKLKHRKSSDESSDEEIDEELKKIQEEDDKKYDPIPDRPKPIHRWSAPLSVMSRQYGYSNKCSPDLFRYKCYGSLHMVERLELMYKMKTHDGCVNALNFNNNGTKLVTGSDDLDVVIWDWTTSDPILHYNSGHTSNVFQAKFMPLSDDCRIITCARDGQVRIAEFSPEGSFKGTRKIGQHRTAAHKLAVQKDSPHVFLSSAEDGIVLLFDLRLETGKHSPQKLITFKENENRIPLYSIAINPLKPTEYVVGGRSPYVKVYDTRFTNEENAFIKMFCPEHLVNREIKANVTSAVYNYNGEEILVSYNEDIYLFSNYETDSSQYLHRYRGHRNSQTIKGVNFFGFKSEFIVSGSDCGYIFFWEKESEHIVKYMYGDEMGVVNCLEPHPHMPVLATSGLDDDVKIWVPSCENEPDLSKLREHVISNLKEQEEDSLRECSDAFVDQTILFLMQHLSRARTRQREVDVYLKKGKNISKYVEPAVSNEGGENEENNSSTSDSEMEDFSDIRHVLECSQS